MNPRFPLARGANWRQRFLAIGRQAEGVVAAAQQAGVAGLRARAPARPFEAARRHRPSPPFSLRVPSQG